MSGKSAVLKRRSFTAFCFHDTLTLRKKRLRINKTAGLRGYEEEKS